MNLDIDRASLARPIPTMFLRAWFGNCPPGQFIERRAIRVTDHVVQQAFYSLDAVEDLYGDGCRLVEDHDVYFGVCPRIRPHGRKEDVICAPGLWADLDFKRFPNGETEAMRKVVAFAPQPTWIIATGGGYHLYWHLRESVRADTAFERKLKGLVRTLDADPAATDTSRVLRIPGMFNHKYPDCQVRIIAWPTSN